MKCLPVASVRLPLRDLMVSYAFRSSNSNTDGKRDKGVRKKDGEDTMQLSSHNTIILAGFRVNVIVLMRDYTLLSTNWLLVADLGVVKGSN